MQKTVEKVAQGVNISFIGEVKKDNIVSMVDNCQKGKCECMSDETKQKIQNMEISGKDGEVELLLSGDVSTDEIKEALAKSKVLN